MDLAVSPFIANQRKHARSWRDPAVTVIRRLSLSRWRRDGCRFKVALHSTATSVIFLFNCSNRVSSKRVVQCKRFAENSPFPNPVICSTVVSKVPLAARLERQNEIYLSSHTLLPSTKRYKFSKEMSNCRQF